MTWWPFSYLICNFQNLPGLGRLVYSAVELRHLQVEGWIHVFQSFLHSSHGVDVHSNSPKIIYQAYQCVPYALNFSSQQNQHTRWATYMYVLNAVYVQKVQAFRNAAFVHPYLTPSHFVCVYKCVFMLHLLKEKEVNKNWHRIRVRNLSEPLMFYKKRNMYKLFLYLHNCTHTRGFTKFC